MLDNIFQLRYISIVFLYDNHGDYMNKDISVGAIMKTTNGTATIIGINPDRTVHIVFNDPPYTTATVKAVNLIKGAVKDRNRPTIKGVGYIGYGPYRSDDPAYRKWFKLFDLEVSPEWHNYQIFAQWFHDNVRPGPFLTVLNKDLLSPRSETYGPRHCRLVPNAIHTLFNTRPNNGRDLPIGISKAEHGYSAHCSHVTNGPRLLGTYVTVEHAQRAYWTEKVKATRDAAHYYRQWLSTDVFDLLSNVTMDEMVFYYRENAIFWQHNNRPTVHIEQGNGSDLIINGVKHEWKY